MSNATQSQTAAHDEIRTMLEAWRQAAIARDVPRIMSYYTPDIVAFDAVMQLQFKGVDAYGKHWAACMEMCTGPMVFEMHDLQLFVDQQFGYGHYLLRCGHQDENGKESGSWMRVTIGLRKTPEGWKIAHDHFSAPFDMESGKALFDLQP
ncbi:nuclear transport factor 2 family protein [Cupriavidus gilardii]|uniref:Nuclear transport factor 2 family protein n=1 Tax=Cupriavidus gilardii TaxID=82541 RepID=A0ABY4VNR9_9BURK|nr:nuclear transport factor 2 family protein [Cupriavidus gilardii]USE78663.1 nuclear transport factor 2 family protein [Cupriavidus gilardii]